MLTVPVIRSRLSSHRPALRTGGPERRAAVAVVLREASTGPDVLLIERARFEGDPWSGHMAFPGGRVETEDRDDRHAAERETLEEVGVSLAGAEYLGHLADLAGRHAGRPSGMVISAHVYVDADPDALAPNHEVATAFWFPVGQLHDPSRHVDYRPAQPRNARFPGILVGEPDRHVVWGLTYRFLEELFRAVGEPLPERPMTFGE